MRFVCMCCVFMCVCVYMYMCVIYIYICIYIYIYIRAYVPNLTHNDACLCCAQGLEPDDDTYTHLLTMCAKAAEAGYAQASDVAARIMHNASRTKVERNVQGIYTHTYTRGYTHTYIYALPRACLTEKDCKVYIYIYTHTHTYICTYISAHHIFTRKDKSAYE